MNKVVKSMVVGTALIGLCSGGVVFAMNSSLDSKLNSTKTIEATSTLNQSSKATEKMPEGAIDAKKAETLGIAALESMTGFKKDSVKVNMTTLKDPNNRWLWYGSVESDDNINFMVDAITGEVVNLDNPTNNEYTNDIDYSKTDYDTFNAEQSKKQDDYASDVKQAASQFTNEKIADVKFNYAGLGEDNKSTYTNMTFIATTENGKECSVTLSPRDKKVTTIFIVTPEIPGALG
ncbi:hypothetical protein DOK76_08690 [Vagococcus sp. DIV0080]|uniref:PepSY domain-containing protein n=1 Tax=Candidatus Vagococcus giribetii TaxID=2230876 RepID=A0ABS3HTS6_9ENTE|nr:hypothetical protein [Vagococcus sp. DIV0080]MBO0477147.1 hypothetical protein [Vagococcus sp. DIV0080]